jgi:ribose 5-phosphate isomerase B
VRLDLKVIIGCDITAHDLKDEIVAILRKKGYEITDADTSGPEHGDFADAAEVVARGIQNGEYQRGILICGTGLGICMAANKFKGIRAGLAYDVFPAVLASADNNTNVLCTGAWVVSDAAHCAKIIEAWLLVKYTGRDAEGMRRIGIIESEY